MIEIPLSAIPNQSLSIQLDQNNFDLRIHDCGNIITFDVTINNVIILQGIRAVASYPLIPYEYLENGNFVILTGNDNQDIPYWDRFGIDQYLIYASQAELEAFNANSST
jgi:hypothetical protein